MRDPTPVLEDLHSALGLGRALSGPSVYFTRILTLFSESDRALLLRMTLIHALASIRPATLEQFVAFNLFRPDPIEIIGGYCDKKRFLSARSPHPDRWREGPHTVHVKDLSTQGQQLVAETISGRSLLGVANVLFSHLFSFSTSSFDDIHAFLQNALRRKADTPDVAAAIVCALRHNSRVVSHFCNEATDLVQDVRLSSFREDLDVYHTQDAHYLSFQPEITATVRDVADDLSEKVQCISNDELPRLQTHLLNSLDLEERFGLLDYKYGVFVPLNRHIEVASSFSELIRRASIDKHELFKMSGRQFEEFLTRLFKQLGFEVELTQASRDGGADIVCLRKDYGIPFRMAVEAKRYAEGRPITVSLVRSFVGANLAFRANKLVYVTTSSYTGPAMEYAQSCASHLRLFSNSRGVADLRLAA